VSPARGRRQAERARGGMVAGRRATLEAVRTGRAQEILVARGSRSTPALQDLLDAATERRVPVREASRTELGAFDRDHHGVVALVEGAPELGERHLASWPFGQEDLVVVLDGITDPQNLGAAARAAEAAGTVMLVTRIRRAASVTPAAVKASAGALLHLPHARVANIARALERLKEAGFFVVGLDEAAEATVYDRPCPPGRVTLVVGSEGEGLSRLTREACDELVRLPMRGRVASLNAAASLAAVLYAFVLPSRRS
jgi:23S rRNA (guanosine2251-2'-O)-methyltransferase